MGFFLFAIFAFMNGILFLPLVSFFLTPWLRNIAIINKVPKRKRSIGSCILIFRCIFDGVNKIVNRLLVLKFFNDHWGRILIFKFLNDYWCLSFFLKFFDRCIGLGFIFKYSGSKYNLNTLVFRLPVRCVWILFFCFRLRIRIRCIRTIFFRFSDSANLDTLDRRIGTILCCLTLCPIPYTVTFQYNSASTCCLKNNVAIVPRERA